MCKAVEEYGNRRAQERALTTKIDDIKSIMTNLKLTIDQAMQALNIEQEEQTIIKGLIK